ncbi:MAG: hypothetical protein JWO71_2121 [Candidatus Acidoferrum typicum]|nr:hypothetical protein [Candidatus Acidoferrum typicum]
MKASRFLILVVALLALGSSALADPIDPAIGVKGGGGGSTLWLGFTTVTFLPGQTGVTCTGGTCSYSTPQNNPFFIASGSITDFAYLFSQSQNIGFSVFTDSVFQTLTVVNGVNSRFPLAILSGGTILPAPTCIECIGTFATTSNTVVGDFLLELGGVKQGTTVLMASNVPIPVPEPAALLLLGSGLVALAFRRKTKKATDVAV